MWFDDEDISGRRLFAGKRNTRRKPVLQVNARLNIEKKAGMYRVAVFVLVPTIILAAGILVWKGLGLAEDLLFSKNDRFTITTLEIKTEKGAVISPDLVREYTQLSEGMNLFEFNIRKIRDEFMHNAPNLQSMKISRHLPHTLKIDMMERVPLAQLGWRKALVADSEGCVFARRPGSGDLPVITGYSAESLRPGSRIHGMGLASLHILDACSNPKLGLHVVSVHAGKKEHIAVRIRHNGKKKEIDLNWRDMGERTRKSREDLLKKLSAWAIFLETEKGRKLTHFDGTFDDRIFGKRL